MYVKRAAGHAINKLKLKGQVEVDIKVTIVIYKQL
jgi:hypothetical protein